MGVKVTYILLTALYICAEPKIINHTDNWTPSDQKVVSRAKEVCQKQYKACVKYVIKKDNVTFNVICSKDPLQRGSSIVP